MGEFNCIQFQDGKQSFIVIPINNKERKNSFSSNIFDGSEQHNSNCCDQLFNNKAGLEAAKNNTNPINIESNNNSLKSRLDALEKLIKDFLNNLNNKSDQSSETEPDAPVVDPMEAKMKELENVVNTKKEQQLKDIGKNEIKLLDKTLSNYKTAEQPVTTPDKVKQKKKKAPVKMAAKKKTKPKEEDGWWNTAEQEMRTLGLNRAEYIRHKISIAAATDPEKAKRWAEFPDEIFADLNESPHKRDALIIALSHPGLTERQVSAIVNSRDYMPVMTRHRLQDEGKSLAKQGKTLASRPDREELIGRLSRHDAMMQRIGGDNYYDLPK